MATAYIREYAALAMNGAVQAGREPATADQTVSTSATTASASAFNVNTRFIAISTPAAQAVACKFSATRGAAVSATTSNLRLPANSIIFFGVEPGDIVALIDVA